MPNFTPKITVPVRADNEEHRRLAGFFGRYRKQVDGRVIYSMTEKKAERFRLLREADLTLAKSRQKRGHFLVPGQKASALTLSQAVAVAAYIIASRAEAMEHGAEEAFGGHSLAALP